MLVSMTLDSRFTEKDQIRTVSIIQSNQGTEAKDLQTEIQEVLLGFLFSIQGFILLEISLVDLEIHI